MALAVSLRYGELSHFWLAGPLVLAGAVGLLWWGHKPPALQAKANPKMANED